MGWEKITIYSLEYPSELVYDVQKAFESVWIPMGAPKDAALYRTTESPTEPLVWGIYLTPGAAEISKLVMKPFRPKPVDPPDMNSVQLLMGHGTTPIPISISGA